eukprot:2216437-Pyramimonas_sp.AAC.1
MYHVPVPRGVEPSTLGHSGGARPRVLDRVRFETGRSSYLQVRLKLLVVLAGGLLAEQRRVE